jgi:hypothetical protein
MSDMFGERMRHWIFLLGIVMFLVFVFKCGFREETSLPTVTVDMSQAQEMTPAEIYNWSHK